MRNSIKAKSREVKDASKEKVDYKRKAMIQISRALNSNYQPLYKF